MRLAVCINARWSDPPTASAYMSRQDTCRGRHRVRLGNAWYKVGTKCVQNGYKVGTKWVQIGYKVGTKWVQSDTKCVQNGYKVRGSVPCALV